MESIVTTILTNETVRTPEAVESLLAQTATETADPWLSKAE